MAEHAANISSLEHKKPNILELIAQDSFTDSIIPAVKVLCTYLSSKNEVFCNWLHKWQEEAFLATNIILQYYYLKVFNSSFSEGFYGLKRIPYGLKKIKARLPNSLIASSLLFLVVVPYINRKVQIIINDYYENPTLRTDVKKRNMFITALRLQKTMGMVYGGLKMYYMFAYLTGYSKVHDPLLKLSGVELVYQDRNLPSWIEMMKAVFLRGTINAKLRWSLFIKLMATSLEMGAFFIQFLNWWHSDNAKVLSNLPVPKHPHLNIESKLCPLCHSKRKNEVVLLTSGYIFCYVCIKEYIDKNGKCPISFLPSSVDNIIRLYSTNKV